MGLENKQVASVFSSILKRSGRDHTQSHSLSTHTLSSPSAQLAYFLSQTGGSLY